MLIQMFGAFDKVNELWPAKMDTRLAGLACFAHLHRFVDVLVSYLTGVCSTDGFLLSEVRDLYELQFHGFIQLRVILLKYTY